MPEWVGPTCLMCEGTGKDRFPVYKDSYPFKSIAAWIELDLPCRACNGHGREAK